MNPVDLVLLKHMGGDMKFPENVYPQMRVDYDGNNNAVYVGIAKRGKASSDAAWLIEKLTYDGSNNMTLSQTSPENSVWDDRASLSYA